MPIPSPNPRGQRPVRMNEPQRGINASVGQGAMATSMGYHSLDNGNSGVPVSGVNSAGVRVPFVNGKTPEQVAQEKLAATAATAPRSVPGILNPQHDANGNLVGGIDEKTGEQITLQNGRLVPNGKPNAALVQQLKSGAGAAPTQNGNGAGAAPAPAAPATPLTGTQPVVAPVVSAGVPGPQMAPIEKVMTPSPVARPNDGPAAQAAVAAAAPAIQPPPVQQGGYGMTRSTVPGVPAPIQVAPGQNLNVGTGQNVSGGTAGARVVPIAPQYGGGVGVTQEMDADAPSYIGGAAGRFIGSDEKARNERLGGTAGSLPEAGPVVRPTVTPQTISAPATPNQPISAPQTLPATSFPAPQRSLTNPNPGEVDPMKNMTFDNGYKGLSTGVDQTAPMTKQASGVTDSGFAPANGLGLNTPKPLGNPLPGGVTKPEDFAGALPGEPVNNTPAGGMGENDLGTGRSPSGLNVPAPTAANLYTGTGYKPQPSELDAMQHQTEEDEAAARNRREATSGPKF